MATATYTLGNFIADLDRITRDETSPHVITERVAPLLAKLVKNPGVVPGRIPPAPPGPAARPLHAPPRAPLQRDGGRLGAARDRTRAQP